ncbi:putative CCR4-associated factor 1 [Citrus sinensis]|uniref:poly(A)-specific ribonuclease n=1 Tax=Citrus clementina TaxID=85681 RepID=V4TLB7_CITCL|nr:putative CCR4-associated factor 1 homolog 8 [Citrus x clementina]XP_015380641.1 putative CCR4-associated factor 1 homolog 8 [Citrus sinensis]ESR61253.1 hypothetical protein CICLE_v10016106mg [Citrus x clementina]KAH9745783.1 putative CCR4-associated factor 1 [Citrus sinensis]
MAVVSKILNVWCENFEIVMRFLDKLLNCFNVLSIDTEFPGFLRNTPRNAPAVESYNDLKFNVDCTHLIQLGITLSDNEGKISYTFEFNFSDFDLKKDLHAGDSIQLLKDSGLDFDKIRKDGIPRCVFAPRFLEVLSKHRENLKWVTFHGLYDVAYLVKIFTNDALPPTAEAFSGVAALFFQSVFDIKVVAGYCQGLQGLKLGLSKLARILNVKRHGGAHHAGSDSLLTAAVFAEMKNRYELEESAFDGFLYGLDSRIESKPAEIMMFQYMQPLVIPQPLLVPTQFHHPLALSYYVPA